MTKPDSNRWAEVSPYLDQALELDPLEREPWLAALGSTQPLLAAELRELLALHAANRASGFLERSPLRNEESLAGQLTPGYAAPEQLRGEPISPASDVSARRTAARAGHRPASVRFERCDAHAARAGDADR